MNRVVLSVFIYKAVTYPNAPAIARRTSVRNITAVLILGLAALICGTLQTARAQISKFNLNGIALGEAFDPGKSKYSDYSCKPSEAFSSYLWCQTSKKIRISGRRATQYSTIAHTRGEAIQYAMIDTRPLRQSRQEVLAEITKISSKLGGQPTSINWSDGEIDGRRTVIATWSEARLRELGWEAVDSLAGGESPNKGILIDTLGDLKQSAQHGYGAPIYKIVGGSGYVFAASFGATNSGHQHHVVIDAHGFLSDVYTRSLKEILKKDQSLTKDDLSLWPDVAFLTRDLSLNTSPEFANKALDSVFEGFSSRKLWSHVWSILPGSTILGLSQGIHRSTVDIYGSKTKFPEIRKNLKDYISTNPSDPFIEFGLYAVGEFAEAQKANTQSLIKDVLNYAMGFKILSPIVQDSFDFINPRRPPGSYQPEDIDDKISEINDSPELHDNKPLSTLIAGFSERANAARPFFEAVLENKTSRHADDAAYMLGWLARHEGKYDQARRFFSKALSVGMVSGYEGSLFNDYGDPGAKRQVVRLNQDLSPQDQVEIIKRDDNLIEVPAFWYVAARKAFRDQDYEKTIRLAEEALTKLGAEISRLPTTTDPIKISEALERIKEEFRWNININEIVYLMNASYEFIEFKNYIENINDRNSENVKNKIEYIVIKYSKIEEPDEFGDNKKENDKLSHKDFRQALKVIELSLENLKKSEHLKLREWLHYRKIRILANYKPKKILPAIDVMEDEFPDSQLLDDVWTEKVYAEGFILKDIDAMWRTFNTLNEKYPNGNAIDNAHSWMAIALRCAGRVEEAQEMNRTILRRFPLSRHSLYAVKRLKNPDNCGIWFY